ncbi:unnamed protein product [Nezara viridula]|uniref:Uncharacterized protein n=1 Tax=Nezara viridula TaxID=85310 RepID=A0A9P0E7L2_NEZVI|nr:unnamed protein product [Nezara viridula]
MEGVGWCRGGGERGRWRGEEMVGGFPSPRVNSLSIFNGIWPIQEPPPLGVALLANPVVLVDYFIAYLAGRWVRGPVCPSYFLPSLT